jgi:hypothetical protein
MSKGAGVEYSKGDPYDHPHHSAYGEDFSLFAFDDRIRWGLLLMDGGIHSYQENFFPGTLSITKDTETTFRELSSSGFIRTYGLQLLRMTIDAFG